MLRRTFLSTIAAAAAIAAAATGPKVIAHRGYWDTEGSAQNSIRAIVKADSIQCYASEFDVWMTSDSVLVVNHDPDINGIHIESSPSEIVLAQKLRNGEHVPTLESYLSAATQLQTRLVCELKPHDSREHEKAAVRAILAMVKRHGLGDRVDYITFSKDGFSYLLKKAPGPAGVYYLNGDYTPMQIKHLGGAGVDYELNILKKHPEWINDCHSLGLLVNVWTVNKPEDMKWCIENGVDFITTNAPETLQKLISGHKR